MDYKDLISKMTLEDKASLLVGFSNMRTKPFPNLDIPSLLMSDGPNGVRKWSDKTLATDPSYQDVAETCFPSGSTISNSWDNNLFYEIGQSIALECRYFNINAILGPAINIKRNPLCGRNFEYLSEDPLLAGYLSSYYIKGVQDNGVLACIKHYACNNLEKWRYVGDSIVDLRALNEIYIKGFEIAIRESNPGMLMTSYNQINGAFASQNEYLINDRLRNKFKYDGLTVCDWGGMVNRDLALNAGQDLEMPGMVNENIQKIIDGVNSGLISMETVDESVRRILTAIDKTRIEKLEDKTIFDKSKEACLKGALEGAVLLKNNENILPLSLDKKYVIIGDLFENLRFQGGGSAFIDARGVISNKKAFEEGQVQYIYAQGYSQIDTRVNPALEDEAIKLAEGTDMVLFFGGLSDSSESEGFDRDNMKLDANQIHLIERLVALNKKIVFIMYGGSSFEIPHVDRIDAMLFMGLPGERGGQALFKLLFGEVSPSGKLTQTWAKSYLDIPFAEEYTVTPNELYKESIYVGYRFFHTVRREVLFPFGYGLTYGKYKLSNLHAKVEKQQIDVTFAVKNGSEIPLSAIAQIYISKPDSVIRRPEKELKGYARIDLQPNETKEGKIIINMKDLAVYETNSGLDKIEDGEYIIYLSESIEHSIDKVHVRVKGEELEPDLMENEYLNLINIDKRNKEKFEMLIGRKIPDYQKAKKPFTIETPICELDSFFGRIIQKEMTKQGDKIIKQADKEKDEVEKIRKIKEGTFLKKMILVNCLRSLSFSSSGLLPYQKALGLVDLANGKIFKAIKQLTKK